MSGLSSGWVSDCPAPQRQHAATGRAAPLRPHEICRSTAARSADCARGNASENSRSCSRHPPPKDPRGRARGSAARYSAAHPARHSYTVDHLAGIPLAQPLLGSNAWGWGWGSALTGYRGWIDRASKAEAWAGRARSDRPRKLNRARKPRLGYGEACCPARNALSSARARMLRARASATSSGRHWAADAPRARAPARAVRETHHLP